MKYINENGFVKKTQAEIISKYQEEFRSKMDSQLDFSPSTLIGQFISIISKAQSDIWESNQELYLIRDPSQATGVSLDNIVLENGIRRLAATATQVEAVLFGDDGTTIIAGKIARQQTTNIDYTLNADVSISKLATCYVYISLPTLTVGNTYTVIINAVSYSHVALITDTKTTVLQSLKTLIDAGTFAGNANVSNEQLIIDDLVTNFSIDVNTNLKIENLGIRGNFSSTQKGKISLPANTLNIIATPVSGWQSVNNFSAGITGINVERDEELRLRREISINNGNATESAIIEDIRNNVDGVSYIGIYSNVDNVTDVNGIPPHAFEVIVLGGDSQKIARSIFGSKALGITSYGNTEVYIIDSNGQNTPMYFSRPVNKYVWVKVKRSLYNEEIYPINGDQLIKDSIVNWSLDINNINIGKDVIRQRLYTPVYSAASGIKDIIVEIAVTNSVSDTPTYGLNNIAISIRELAVFSTDRIIVENL